VRLDTGQKIGGAEVGENDLDGWKFVREGYFEGLVDSVGVAERCEGGARKHVGKEVGACKGMCGRYGGV